MLYRLLPKRDKEGISEEEFTTNIMKDLPALEETAKELKRHLNEPMRLTENTAALFYQSGGAELLFEDGHWRILAVH